MQNKTPICFNCLERLEPQHECKPTDVQLARTRNLGGGVFAVAIHDDLQLTQHGLGRALLRIPFQERRGSKSYQFGKEWREGRQRWIEIICG
jgi:hypothetical protein